MVDQKVFGNKRRNGLTVQRFAVYEGGDGVRFHYHLLVDVPDVISAERLRSIILEAWRKSDWGYEVNDFVPCDDGWANYITKLATKQDYGLAIDWTNVAIAPRSI